MKTGTVRLPCVLAALVCLPTALAARQPSPSTGVGDGPHMPGRGAVVARVNGTPIYQADLDSALAGFSQANGIAADAPEEQRRQARRVVLDGLIGSELLYQRARSVPIEVSAQELEGSLAQAARGLGEAGLQAEMARRGLSRQDLEETVRKNLVVQKLIQDTVMGAVTVADAEMRSFYDGHTADLTEPEQVEASHILVKSADQDPPDRQAAARRRAEEALARLKAGETFEAMAQQYSEDRSASAGGALGRVRRGDTVPPFEEALFKLDPGQTSGIVRSQFGFHIIKVTSRHPARTVPFDEARGQIGEYLKRRKTEEAIRKMVESLRAAARVEIL